MTGAFVCKKVSNKVAEIFCLLNFFALCDNIYNESRAIWFIFFKAAQNLTGGTNELNYKITALPTERYEAVCRGLFSGNDEKGSGQAWSAYGLDAKARSII